MPNIATSRRFAAAGGGETLTYQDVTSNADSATVTIPAGAAEDGTEFVVLFDTARSSTATAPTYVLPTDFTEIGEIDIVGGVASRCVVSYKILTSGDAGATVTGLNDTGMTKHLVRYSFSSVISTITVGDYEEYANNGDIASVTLGASAGASPLVAMATANANSAPSVSASWTPDFSDTQSGAGALSLVEALIMNSSPSDVTWDPSDVGARNISITFFLEVA